MKIVTETTIIECTAEELRQSNSLSDGFYNILRGVFNRSVREEEEETILEEEDE